MINTYQDNEPNCCRWNSTCLCLPGSNFRSVLCEVEAYQIIFQTNNSIGAGDEQNPFVHENHLNIIGIFPHKRDV